MQLLQLLEAVLPRSNKPSVLFIAPNTVTALCNGGDELGVAVATQAEETTIKVFSIPEKKWTSCVFNLGRKVLQILPWNKSHFVVRCEVRSPDFKSNMAFINTKKCTILREAMWNQDYLEMNNLFPLSRGTFAELSSGSVSIQEENVFVQTYSEIESVWEPGFAIGKDGVIMDLRLVRPDKFTGAGYYRHWETTRDQSPTAKYWGSSLEHLWYVDRLADQGLLFVFHWNTSARSERNQKFTVSSGTNGALLLLDEVSPGFYVTVQEHVAIIWKVDPVLGGVQLHTIVGKTKRPISFPSVNKNKLFYLVGKVYQRVSLLL